MNGWLIFLALLAAYVGVVMLFRQRGGRIGTAELNGPFIMWRTQFGKRAIRTVATPRRFWNVVADVGIVATWLTGLAIFALLIYQLTLYFTVPEVVAESGQSPQFLIGLPGVNPLIPLWWGLVALVVALVIHEGSHGVMAFVGKMRVKSLGLLFFIVPIGAFVEPDEEDLERATAREKNRVFAAGPASNLVVALVAGLILSTVFMSSISAANDGDGVGVGTVIEGMPADDAGLRTGDIIVELRDVTIYPPGNTSNGTQLATAGVERDSIPVLNTTAYFDTLNWTRAGDNMTIVFLREGAQMLATVTLVDRYEYLEGEQPGVALESDRGKGFMGVTPVNLVFVQNIISILRDPFASGFPESFSTGGPTALPGSFFIYIAYPFIIFQTGVDIFAEPYRAFVVVDGPLASVSPALFFGIATLLYWIVWIDIMLGTFNALPAGPLDGGQMLRATLRDRLMRRYRVDKGQLEVSRQELGGVQVRGKDEETQAKLDRIQHVLSRTTWTLGLFILGLILLPIFGPGIVKLIIGG